MPSKKGSVAYYARNARRQVDRWTNALGKITRNRNGTTKNERAAARQMINQFKQLKSQTYKPKGKSTKESDQSIQEAVFQIRSLAKAAKMATGEQGASNLFTQQQINIASRRYEKPEDNPSIYTREEVKVFYRSTQRIWQTPGEPVDTHTINRKIMNYFKTSSLKEAMEKVLNAPQNKQLLERIKLGKTPYSQMTDEQRELYEKLRDSDTSDYDQQYFASEVFMFDDSTDLRKLYESE